MKTFIIVQAVIGALVAAQSGPEGSGSGRPRGGRPSGGSHQCMQYIMGQDWEDWENLNDSTDAQSISSLKLGGFGERSLGGSTPPVRDDIDGSWRNGWHRPCEADDEGVERSFNPAIRECLKCEGGEISDSGRCVCPDSLIWDVTGECVATCGGDRTLQSEGRVCKCDISTVYNANTESCDCHPSFYKEEGVCTKCSQGCQECESATVCSVCHESATLADGACSCGAETSFKSELFELESDMRRIDRCVACTEAGQFWNGSACDSCIGELSYNETAGECQECPVGTYWYGGNCFACKRGCGKCSDWRTCEQCFDNFDNAEHPKCQNFCMCDGDQRRTPQGESNCGSTDCPDNGFKLDGECVDSQ